VLPGVLKVVVGEESIKAGSLYEINEELGRVLIINAPLISFALIFPANFGIS
jgi:hypothetical protein